MKGNLGGYSSHGCSLIRWRINGPAKSLAKNQLNVDFVWVELNEGFLCIHSTLRRCQKLGHPWLVRTRDYHYVMGNTRAQPSGKYHRKFQALHESVGADDKGKMGGGWGSYVVFTCTGLYIVCWTICFWLILYSCTSVYCSTYMHDSTCLLLVGNETMVCAVCPSISL